MNRQSEAEGIHAICHYCLNAKRTFKLNQLYLVCAACIQESDLHFDSTIEEECRRCQFVGFGFECINRGDRAFICGACIPIVSSGGGDVTTRDVVLRECGASGGRPNSCDTLTQDVSSLLPVDFGATIYREMAMQAWNAMSDKVTTHNKAMAVQAENEEYDSGYESYGRNSPRE